MKALSIRQPWGEFFTLGFKKLEIRSWQTNYRGPLLICASAKPADWVKIDPEKSKNKMVYLYDSNGLAVFCYTGVTLFTCDLTDIEPFLPAHEPAAMVNYSPGLFAWHFENIRRVKPIAIKGKLNFFEVPENLIIHI